MIFFPFDFSLSSEILRARLNKQIYTNAGCTTRCRDSIPFTRNRKSNRKSKNYSSAKRKIKWNIVTWHIIILT